MYAKLRQEIDKIKIIDNHGHPGYAEFTDKLPKELSEKRSPAATDIYRTPKESSRTFKYHQKLHYEAYDKIYGFTKQDIDNPRKRDQLTEIYEKKRKQMSKEITKILDISGIDIIIANFVLPNSYKNNSRVKFIPSIDPLLFPYNNQHFKKTPSSQWFLPVFELLNKEWKKKHNYSENGLRNYLTLIDHVLDDFVEEGVVGFKFLSAYIRTTLFKKIDPNKAPTYYEKAKQGDKNAYHKIQDYFAWHLMKKIVSLDMPLQIHCGLIDSHVSDFDPLNFTHILEDPYLSKGKYVVLHGGYPRYERAEVLALAGGVSAPNNVFIDFSGRMTLFEHPKIIARFLRGWLEKPLLWDKILYGSDVLMGERFLYTCSRNGRDAVYMALSSMVDDDIIDEDMAILIAKKILRENAMKLYKL